MTNKELVEKYPWMAIQDEESTWADYFAKGWWDSFGLKMCEELDAELRKLPEEFYNSFRVEQVKEKFGALRFYVNWATEEMHDIIDKYENLSETICAECGSPATKVTTGWIGYYCDKCAPKEAKEI